MRRDPFQCPNPPPTFLGLEQLQAEREAHVFETVAAEEVRGGFPVWVIMAGVL
jgi:hypothetical protein